MSQVQASEVPAAAAEQRPVILRIYKTLAYITGVGVIILFFVGLPLQYGAGNKIVDEVVGPIHGFLYIGYILVALTMSLQARFHPAKTLLVVAAGTVPVCTFVVEHFITKQAEAAILRNRAKARARRKAAAAGTRPQPGRPANRPTPQRVPRQANPAETNATSTPTEPTTAGE